MFGYEGVGLVIVRMVIIFSISLIIVRLMGNRAVGQLSPFDFVLMVGVGDIVANVALADNEMLYKGAEGLVAILLLQQALARLALKNTTMRKWFEGSPVTLIQDGKILPQNFVKTNFNYDDLRQELHKMGMDISNIKDIRVARLESCGEFSLILTHEAEPMTRRDFEGYLDNISTNPMSSMGQKLVSFEQFMSDIHILAKQVQADSLSKASGTGEAMADSNQGGDAR